MAWSTLWPTCEWPLPFVFLVGGDGRRLGDCVPGRACCRTRAANRSHTMFPVTPTAQPCVIAPRESQLQELRETPCRGLTPAAGFALGAIVKC